MKKARRKAGFCMYRGGTDMKAALCATIMAALQDTHSLGNAHGGIYDKNLEAL